MRGTRSADDEFSGADLFLIHFVQPDQFPLAILKGDFQIKFSVAKDRGAEDFKKELDIFAGNVPPIGQHTRCIQADTVNSGRRKRPILMRVSADLDRKPVVVAHPVAGIKILGWRPKLIG